MLTSQDFLSIWESVSMFKQKEFDFTLFLKSTGDAGTLWYFDSDSNHDVIIAQGDINISYSENDIIYLTIGEKHLILNPEIKENILTSFELDVPDFGLVLFVQKRG